MIVEVKRQLSGNLKGQFGPLPQVAGVDPHVLSVISQVTQDFNQLTKGKDKKALGKRIRGYKIGIFFSLIGVFVAIAKLLHSNPESAAILNRFGPSVPVSSLSEMRRKWDSSELEKISDSWARKIWESSVGRFYQTNKKPLLTAQETREIAAHGTLRQYVMDLPDYAAFARLQKKTAAPVDIVKLLAEAEAKTFKDTHGDYLLEALRNSDLASTREQTTDLAAHKQEESEPGVDIKAVVKSRPFKNTLRVVLVIASGMLIYFLNQMKIKAQRIAHHEAREFLKTVSREKLATLGVVAVTTPEIDRLIFTHNNKRAALQCQQSMRAYMQTPAPQVMYQTHQMADYPAEEMVRLNPHPALMMVRGLQYPHRMHPACRPSSHRPYPPQYVPAPLAHQGPHGYHSAYGAPF